MISTENHLVISREYVALSHSSGREAVEGTRSTL